MSDNDIAGLRLAAVPVGDYGSYRVLRGSSWNDYGGSCRSAYRCWDAPTFRYYDVGFRVVLSARTFCESEVRGMLVVDRQLKAGDLVAVFVVDNGKAVPVTDSEALARYQTMSALTHGAVSVMKFIYIPPGEFLMGSPETEKDRSEDEGPQHLVRLTKPFCVGQHPVTQAQWEAVMGSNPSYCKHPDNPVECVSWTDAKEFCKKLSALLGQPVRLPTEAEWEYACRAGTTTAYFFGDDPAKLGDYAWYSENADMRPHPVGLKKPNPWGLFDMLGNVWEWCEDWYADKYQVEKMTPEEIAAEEAKRRIHAEWPGVPALKPDTRVKADGF